MLGISTFLLTRALMKSTSGGWTSFKIDNILHGFLALTW